MTSNAAKLIVIDREFDGEKPMMRSGVMCSNGDVIDGLESGYGAKAAAVLVGINATKAAIAKLDEELKKIEEGAQAEAQEKIAPLAKKAQEIAEIYGPLIEAKVKPFKEIIEAIKAKATAEIEPKVAALQAQANELGKKARAGEISREQYEEAIAGIRAQAAPIVAPIRDAANANIVAQLEAMEVVAGPLKAEMEAKVDPLREKAGAISELIKERVEAEAAPIVAKKAIEEAKLEEPTAKLTALAEKDEVKEAARLAAMCVSFVEKTPGKDPAPDVKTATIVAKEKATQMMFGMFPVPVIQYSGDSIFR